jgi:hypothetical protein
VAAVAVVAAVVAAVPLEAAVPAVVVVPTVAAVPPVAVAVVAPAEQVVQKVGDYSAVTVTRHVIYLSELWDGFGVTVAQGLSARFAISFHSVIRSTRTAY